MRPDNMTSVFSPLATAKRLVIKLGTQVVVDPTGGLSLKRLQHLVEQFAALSKAGKEIILVSSGALGLGRQQLGIEKAESLSEKQAFTAIGQPLLMEAYRKLFGQHNLLTAQVLLTALDFSNRTHYLNLKQTFETLLRLGIIPIINENDVVSTMELQDEGYSKSYIKAFGDNDKLSALVASKLDADLLVILTNVDGLYTGNPETQPDAKRIPVLENFHALRDIQTSGQSLLGRGGMGSKLEAARVAAISGIHTFITSGLSPDTLQPLLNGIPDAVSGTLILPQASLRAKKVWIGLASGYYGAIIINEGARQALVEKQASLLPIGIIGATGIFSAHQVVSIQDEAGEEIGRGLTDFSSEEIDKIKGIRSEQIAGVLGIPDSALDRDVVIHRDNLVIFQEYGM